MQFSATPSDEDYSRPSKAAKDPRLPVEVRPGDPEHLALSYHLCCFNSLNHCPRRCRCPWPLHCAQATFDPTVIGLDSVIAVATGALSAMPAQVTFGLQFPDCGRIAPQHPVRRCAVGGCHRSPRSVSGTAWLLRGRASGRGRNQPSDLAHPQPGTRTSICPRSAQKSHPCAMCRISA